MRPAGLIPSFQPDRVALSGYRPVKVDIPIRSPVPARPSVRFAAARGDCRCVPITGPRAAAPACLFQDAWPRPPPRRSVSVSTVKCTFHSHHSRINSSARFACPPFREDLRAGFPCALGHPWLVTPAPANWGPVFFRDSRRPGTVDASVRRMTALSREQPVRKLCKCFEN